MHQVGGAFGNGSIVTGVAVAACSLASPVRFILSLLVKNQVGVLSKLFNN